MMFGTDGTWEGLYINDKPKIFLCEFGDQYVFAIAIIEYITSPTFTSSGFLIN